MPDYSGVTWRVNYGEISERNQFRVGYIGQQSFDAYFEVTQITDLISVLTAVQGMSIGQLSKGTTVQARKASAGVVTTVIIEPRLDTFPPQIMNLDFSTLPDLIYALQLFQADLSDGAFPDDWDNTEKLGVLIQDRNGGLRTANALPVELLTESSLISQIGTPGTPVGDQLNLTFGSVKSLSDFMRPVAYAAGVTVGQIDDPSLFIASLGSVVWDSPLIGYPAGNPVAVNPGTPYSPGCRLLTTGGGNVQSLPMSFYANGKIGIHVTLGADTDVWVSIDGRPVSADPFIIRQADTATFQPFVTIALPDDGGAFHRYDITLGWGANFIQVINEPGTLLTPGERAPFTVALTGDSYSDSGIAPYYGGPSEALRHFTGWNVIPLGQGSTGYTNDGTSSGDATKQVYGGAARVAALEASNPDVVLVVGSVNDGAASAAAVKAAALAYYANLAPLPVVVVGVEPLYDASDPTFATWDANNTALAEAAAEAPNVIGFINWRGEDWLTGTGSLSNPQYDGNQDWSIGDQAGTDTIHPNHWGWKLLLMPRLVSALAPLKI